MQHNVSYEIGHYRASYSTPGYWQSDLSRDMRNWCDEQFGICGWDLIGEYFCFQTEQDQMLFTLRWL